MGSEGHCPVRGEDAKVPRTARLVSSYPHWPGSDVTVKVLCLGNGFHAKYCEGDAAAEIQPCDCEAHLLEVPEFVKESLRKHLKGR